MEAELSETAIIVRVVRSYAIRELSNIKNSDSISPANCGLLTTRRNILLRQIRSNIISSVNQALKEANRMQQNQKRSTIAGIETYIVKCAVSKEPYKAIDFIVYFIRIYK